MGRGCRNCMWLYHMVTYNPTAPCSECLDHDKWQTTKQTNADRIRSMSDEELGELLNSIQGDAYLVGFNTRAESRYTPYGKSWLDWLRQEVEK